MKYSLIPFKWRTVSRQRIYTEEDNAASDIISPNNSDIFLISCMAQTVHHTDKIAGNGVDVNNDYPVLSYAKRK